MTETPSPLFKRRQTAIEVQTSPAINANSQGNNIFFVKTRLVIFDYPIQVRYLLKDTCIKVYSCQFPKDLHQLRFCSCCPCFVQGVSDNQQWILQIHLQFPCLQ